MMLERTFSCHHLLRNASVFVGNELLSTLCFILGNVIDYSGVPTHPFLEDSYQSPKNQC